MNGSAARRLGLLGAIGVWAVCLATIAFIRFRTQWPAYVELHHWLHDQGLPKAIRTLDYTLLMLLPVVAGTAILRLLSRTSVRDGLYLRWPPRPGARVTLIAAAPMLLGGLALMLARDTHPTWGSFFSGVVRAPVLEELVMRGLLVGIPLALLAGRRRAFWTLAILAGLVFGFLHVRWSIGGIASGWPNLLVTAAGGVWYAWLMREWRSLLPPMLLHAAMNLCWWLAGSSGAGGGGLTENLLRAATIAIATVLTIRTAPATPAGA